MSRESVALDNGVSSNISNVALIFGLSGLARRASASRCCSDCCCGTGRSAAATGCCYSRLLRKMISHTLFVRLCRQRELPPLCIAELLTD
jgi:hypothetical protein